jgi:phosphoglycerol transferase MdoB-like AlkP superfamily enzyme
LRRLGLFPSLWLYWLAERRQGDVVPDAPWQARRCESDTPPADALPDLVVVESESFFDARRLHPGIRADVLAHFDRLAGESVLRGRLAVPAWGANTMRTEFAFLTGLGERALGAHRFNPYRLAARRPLPALPACLRALGYRTVCIHPHPASFFERHRVMPNLGFDEFIDLAGFGDAPRAGPYVADAAVGRKIAEVLDRAERPTFVFAITMENHGPLHLERASDEDARRLYAEPPPGGYGDLTVYLRHLANADRMIGALRETLTARSRESVLCFFGDHVPSMPAVYDALGFADGRTDYVVWRSRGGAGEEGDRAAHEIGAALLDAALGVRTAA